jgi:hypothetical protein
MRPHVLLPAGAFSQILAGNHWPDLFANLQHQVTVPLPAERRFYRLSH